jgi:hypothetical protein
VGKLVGKRQLGKPRSRWVNTIKIDLREREVGMVLTGSIWLRRALVNTVMNLWVP